MAWKEYDPKALRLLMLSRNLNAGDVAKRTRGRVGRSTVRNVMIGERPTAQESWRGGCYVRKGPIGCVVGY